MMLFFLLCGSGWLLYTYTWLLSVELFRPDWLLVSTYISFSYFTVIVTILLGALAL